MRTVKLIFLSIVTLIVIAVTLDFFLFLKQPVINKSALDPNHNYVTYEIAPQTGLKDLLVELSNKKIIRRPIDLYLLAELTRRTHIHPGEYHFFSNEKPNQFLNKIVKGNVVQHRITLIEGWSFQQMMWAIQRNPYLQHELVGLTPTAVMAYLGYPGEYPEGLFFPDTYFFTKGTTDVELLQRAYLLMQKKLAKEWQDRAPNLPYRNSYEALIVASMIEKEAVSADERPVIAGVIVNRLTKQMRLQIDPTVIYGMQDQNIFKPKLLRSDLHFPSIYNTYINAGLPPSPIAMPGLASIHAALHPEENSYLYYVSKGNGTHAFSENLEKHQQAIQQYRRRPNAK